MDLDTFLEGFCYCSTNAESIERVLEVQEYLLSTFQLETAKTNKFGSVNDLYSNKRNKRNKRVK